METLKREKQNNCCWLKNNKFETTLIYDILSPFCLFIHNAINCRHFYDVYATFFFSLSHNSSICDASQNGTEKKKTIKETE